MKKGVLPTATAPVGVDAGAPTAAEDATLRALVTRMPESPGVYLMKDHAGRILYVGKAKALRRRVRSYFRKGTGLDPKTRVLVRKIRHIETVVTGSEVEALVLENTLIKRHRPPYNILLRDDKQYPYIRLSLQDPFPRLTVVRRVEKDGAKYYGPYVGAGAMRGTLRVLHDHFPLADCDITIDGNLDRPCLQYQIGRCRAPCTGYQSHGDYAATVARVRQFLEGHGDELVREIQDAMGAAAAAEEFERAARLRDQVRQIEQTLIRQRVTTPGGGEVDVFGLAREGDWLAVQILFVRAGSLVGTKAFVWEDHSGVNDGEVFEGFIQQFYADGVPIPSRLLVPAPVPHRDALEAWLGGMRDVDDSGRRVCRLSAPKRGRGFALLTMAAENATQSLSDRMTAERTGVQGMAALQKILHLGGLPHRIEGFDISHIQGELTVASLVVWEGSGPRKADYRHYRIRSTSGPDDFLAMHEVVLRRYRRLREEGKPLPDMILIDGGRGQLTMALRALEEAGIRGDDLPNVIGLAKERGERFERVYLPGRRNPVNLRPGAPATRILQQIRDEAHRFAITYHRKLRSLRVRDSELDAIPGVGRARKRALLTRFGSVEGLKQASVDEIAATPSVNAAVAQSVWEAVHK